MAYDKYQASTYLTNYEFGLAGLDDAMLRPDDMVLSEDASSGLEGVGVPDAQSKVRQDTLRVVAAASTPGTTETKVVTNRLLHRSIALGKIAHERAEVARSARSQRDQLASQVDKLQPTIDKLATNPDPNAQGRHDVLKQKQFGLARKAVRLEKVNVVSTGLAQNAAAQAVLAQQIAGSVLAGRPALTATLSTMFNKLGQSSASMQKVREQQVVNNADVVNQDRVRALLTQKKWLLRQRLDLDVLLTCAPPGPETNAATRQWRDLGNQVRAINAEVASLCTKRVVHALDLEGLEGLGDLGWFGSKIFRKIKKGVSSVANLAVSTAKVGVLPFTASVKLVTKGPSSALKNISRTMKDNFNQVKSVAGQVFVGLPCALATSSVGKMATTVAGTAVGTFYGGPVGSAVGAAASQRANKLNKSLCGGLDKIGLTRGDFRTSRLGKVLKETARDIAKQTLDPRQAFKDATSIGGSYLGSQGGANAVLNRFGNAQIQKLGVNEILKNVRMPANASVLLRSAGLPNNLTSVLRSAGLPSNASALLRSAGLPSDLPSVLRSAGVPANASAYLRAAGLPSNLPAVLRSAGIQADAQSVLRATSLLQGSNKAINPQSIARVLGRQANRAAVRAASRTAARANVDFNFPAGSAADLLMKYV